MRFALALVSAATTAVLAVAVLQINLFDLFIYQRSAEHGYFGDTRGHEDPLFGRRGAATRALQSYIRSARESAEESALPSAPWSDEGYTVAIVGDSFVWGQGIRNEERFAFLLEERLRSLAPATVISLAMCGDSMVENAIKVHWLERTLPELDLLIVALVDNDMLLNGPDRYDPALYHEILAPFSDRALYMDPPYQGPERRERPYREHQRLAYDSDAYGNYALWRSLAAQRMPLERTLYLTFGAPYCCELTDLYLAPLEERGARVIDLREPFRDLDPSALSRKPYVSSRDPHPSARANEFFAEALFREITGNPVHAFPPSSGGTPARDR